MRLFLPRPLHGWRAFVGEVGVIVLGVLIALGAEQLITRYNWRQDVATARETLRADFREILGYARERQAEDGCIRRRLAEIGAIVGSTPRTVPPLGHIGSPPLRAWQPSSWPSTVSADIAAHFPREEMLRIGWVQSQGMIADSHNERELDDWAELFALVGPGRRMEQDEVARLRRALADAAFRANMLRLTSAQVIEIIRSTGIPTAADWDAVDADLRKTLAGPNARALCGPIGRPMTDRIDAPYDPAIQADPRTG